MQQYQIDFINFIVPGAQQAMKDYNIFASITIAQAIIESGWGRSYSALNDFNLFGVKMPGAKPPNMIIVQGSYATDDGGYYRRYQSWSDSVIDHGFFLENNSRYADLLTKNTYKEQTAGLQAAGYAGVSTVYASALNNCISSYNLTQYDTGTSSTANSNNKGADVVAIARSYRGTAYVYGGNDPSGFDCSGLVQYCYAQVGVIVPRVTYDQIKIGTVVNVSELQQGDLLFFSNTGHVAIYSGNGMMIEAPYTGALVKEVTMRTPESCVRVVSSSVNSSNNSSGSTSNNEQITIPATNYSVIAGSEKFSGVLYGRRYRVIVSDANGVALDVSKLRCTFNISKTIMQQPNFSEVSIYNLNSETENTIIQEGNRVIVEAGYEGEQYGLIFDGDILQPIREKEDGTTYKLTLRSLDGDRFLNDGFLGISMIKGQTARAIVEKCVSDAKYPSELGSISDQFDNAKLTRGKVIFGLARDYLRQIAKGQNATFYVDDNKVNIIKAEDYPEGEIIELSPKSGLIGTPTQNEFGLEGKCLLNPRIKVNSLIHIDNSLVRSMEYQKNQAIRYLDNDGIYRVISMDIIGDTRGNDWYTSFVTVTQAGLLPNMITDTSVNPI